ncbi:MAG: hypothetical protein PGN08_11855 [Sphingomonas taxi]
MLVSRDWGQGTMTASSYPFVVKLVKRGQPLDAATEVFRGAAIDQLGTYAGVMTDGQGNRLVTIERRTTFFGGETHVWTPAGTKKLDIPARAFPAGMVDGQVLFQTSDPWGQVPAGALASAPIANVRAGRAITPTILFAPTPRQSVDEVVTTKDHVVLVYNDNVPRPARRSTRIAAAAGPRAPSHCPTTSRWASPAPTIAAITAISPSPAS